MDKEKIRAFFNQRAAHWDGTLIHDAEKIALILDYAGIEAGMRVLDVACGTGVLFPDYLARGVAHITGIDLSENMIAIARSKFRDRRITLIHGDVENSPLAGQFERCMVYNALPHFPDAAALIAVLAQKVKAGGRLCIAHGMSREKINGRHTGPASAVSCGLVQASALARLFVPYFTVDAVVDNDQIYLVAGQRR